MYIYILLSCWYIMFAIVILTFCIFYIYIRCKLFSVTYDLERNRKKLFGRSIISSKVVKMNPMFLLKPTVHISSAFYQQLIKFIELQ